MQLIFRPEAQAELLAAQAWYEARSPGLGFEFARAIDAAVARAQRAPLSFPCIEADFRHVMTRKFPYSIIYTTTHEQLVVVSCFHHRRRPSSWLGGKT
jgi:plasmid stabilization system protein ParE